MPINPKSLLAPKYPFKNLVFQGGGVKSYVYHGALRVLEEYEILPQIERVGGTSAGALQAAMLCFRLSAEETIEIYKTVDYANIRSHRVVAEQAHTGNRLLNVGLDMARGNLDMASRIIRKYGLYSIAYMQDWLHETIALYCRGNGRATFADFQALGFRELYTTAVNLNRHQAEIFSADTTPDVAVADAIILSAAIPYFFEAIQFDGRTLGQGDFYIDGGALSNYPLTVFDDPKFKKSSRYFTYGVNWETLGCQLFPSDDYSQQKTEINTIIQYAENLIETLTAVQNVAVDLRTVDRWRSIRISDCGVSMIDFEIQPNDLDPKYVEMVQTGTQAAREYLENYHLPTDRFADLKERLTDLFEIWH